MTNEELEKKAKQYATEDLPDGYTRVNLQKKEAYLAGAKAIQKENDAYWQNIIAEQHRLINECRIKTEEENERLQKNNKHIRDLIEAERRRQEECNDVYLRDIATLEEENERLAKRICELQSDLSRVKGLNERTQRRVTLNL